jgi:hypothetical protein
VTQDIVRLFSARPRFDTSKTAGRAVVEIPSALVGCVWTKDTFTGAKPVGGRRAAANARW